MIQAARSLLLVTKGDGKMRTQVIHAFCVTSLALTCPPVDFKKVERFQLCVVDLIYVF